jgi:hypothetical protein
LGDADRLRGPARERPLTAAPVRVLVTSIFDWWSTYRAIRILGLAGAQVETLADPSWLFTRCRFVKRAIPASRNPAALGEALEAQLERERYDWVIVADDILFHYLGSLPNPWWVRPWFPVAPGSRAFDFTVSKLAFAETCRDLGLPIPSFAKVVRLEHALDAARGFGYPVMGKTAFGFGGQAVTRIENDRALRVWWEHVAPPAIVQRFINGQYATTEMLFDRGRLRACFSSLRSDFWPTPLSASTARTLADVPGIVALVERLGEVTQFDGFCGIDWIRADDGTIYLSELNPRPTPGYLLHAEIRAALVAAVRDRWNGAPIRLHSVSGREATLYQFPDRFSFAATNGGMRAWSGAIESLRGAAWDEPGLVVAQVRRAIKAGSDVRVKDVTHAPAR